MSKKKTAIRPSLIQCSTLYCRCTAPMSTPNLTCQKSKKPLPNGELAITMAVSVQRIRMIPDVCSLSRNSVKSAVKLVFIDLHRVCAMLNPLLELYLHPIPRQHTRPEALLTQLFHPPQKNIVMVRVMVGNRQALHTSHLRYLESLIIGAVSPALFCFE